MAVVEQCHYELWRQDDNGNRFSVDVFASQESASETAERFEARSRKQLYWVEAAASELQEPDPLRARED